MLMKVKVKASQEPRIEDREMALTSLTAGEIMIFLACLNFEEVENFLDSVEQCRLEDHLKEISLINQRNIGWANSLTPTLVHEMVR